MRSRRWRLGEALMLLALCLAVAACLLSLYAVRVEQKDRLAAEGRDKAILAGEISRVQVAVDAEFARLRAVDVANQAAATRRFCAFLATQQTTPLVEGVRRLYCPATLLQPSPSPQPAPTPPPAPTVTVTRPVPVPVPGPTRTVRAPAPPVAPPRIPAPSPAPSAPCRLTDPITRRCLVR